MSRATYEPGAYIIESFLADDCAESEDEIYWLYRSLQNCNKIRSITGLHTCQICHELAPTLSSVNTPCSWYGKSQRTSSSLQSPTQSTTHRHNQVTHNKIQTNSPGHSWSITSSKVIETLPSYTTSYFCHLTVVPFRVFHPWRVGHTQYSRCEQACDLLGYNGLCICTRQVEWNSNFLNVRMDRWR